MNLDSPPTTAHLPDKSGQPRGGAPQDLLDSTDLAGSTHRKQQNAASSAVILPRVAIDLTRLKRLHCGLGQFCLHLGRALSRTASAGVSPELFLPLRNHELLPSVPSVSRTYAYPWMKDSLLRKVRPLVSRTLFKTPRYALWHATTQWTQYLPLDERIPVVLTIHDLNFLREQTSDERHGSLASVQALVDRAAAITTISQFVAGEVRENLHLRGKPLKVIYNGLISDEYPHAAPPPFVGERPFLFSIGEVAVKKNLHVLVDMLARLPDYQLIIAGDDRDAYASRIRQLAVVAGVSTRIQLPGIISDEHRHWLYQNCSAFVFPSLTEGFGMPVIEAMRFGKPVFLSDQTSLPEIGGRHAFYWSSFDPDAMCRVFRNGMKIYSQSPNYAALLQAHAAQYSWDKAAAEYLSFYREILAPAQLHERRAAA